MISVFDKGTPMGHLIAWLVVVALLAYFQPRPPPK
jgi:hypothetical protein